MNKAIKKISIWSLFFLIVLALSCVGIEEKFPSKQDSIISGEIASKKDLIQYAYQDYAFASIAIENGNFKDAEIYLREALKNDEDSPYLLMKLSQVLVENSKMEDALHFAQKTVDLTPDDLQAQEFLAEIYSQLKKFDLAITQYRAILKKDP
jgi:predicted Zn-dependent protease